MTGPPPIELKEQHPVFRLEIFGRKPTIEDILGEKFWIGPTPYGGMTHQEFMDMVTPKLAQSYAGFTGKYLLAEIGADADGAVGAEVGDQALPQRQGRSTSARPRARKCWTRSPRSNARGAPPDWPKSN